MRNTFKLCAMAALFAMAMGVQAQMTKTEINLTPLNSQRAHADILFEGKVIGKACKMILEHEQASNTVALGEWHRDVVEANGTVAKDFFVSFGLCSMADVNYVEVSGVKATDTTDLANTEADNNTAVRINSVDMSKDINFTNSVQVWGGSTNVTKNIFADGQSTEKLGFNARIVQDGTQPVKVGPVKSKMTVTVIYK